MRGAIRLYWISSTSMFEVGYEETERAVLTMI